MQDSFKVAGNDVHTNTGHFERCLCLFLWLPCTPCSAYVGHIVLFMILLQSNEELTSGVARYGYMLMQLSNPRGAFD